mgnify:CR=1 FL=1
MRSTNFLIRVMVGSVQAGIWAFSSAHNINSIALDILQDARKVYQNPYVVISSVETENLLRTEK